MIYFSPTKVKKLRKERGLTRSQLARAAGFSDAYVGKIENFAIRQPKEPYLRRLAAALGVEVEELFEERVSAPPESLTPDPDFSGGSAYNAQGSRDTSDPDFEAHNANMRKLWERSPAACQHFMALVADMVADEKSGARSRGPKGRNMVNVR